MLIVNDGQLRRASIASLEEQCVSCSQPEARVPARHRQRYKANRLSCHEPLAKAQGLAPGRVPMQ